MADILITIGMTYHLVYIPRVRRQGVQLHKYV